MPSMPSALDIFDYCQTLGISACLVGTIPLASFIYFKLIFCRPFSESYTFKLIVINGISELLNTLVWLFVIQLSSFSFMRGFYVFIQDSGLANPLAAINAFLGAVALNSSLFIALNRMKAMMLMRDKEFLFFLLSVCFSIILSLPSVIDFYFNTSVYVEIPFDRETILIPVMDVTNEFFRALADIIRTVVSLATFLLNIFLHKAERALVVTSILAYATYTVYFVNNMIARYVDVMFCGYAQWLFVGIKSMTPFWCLVVFTPSVRKLIARKRRKTTATAVTITA